MLEIPFLDNSEIFLADIPIWHVFLGFLFFFIVFYWGMKIIMLIWYAIISILPLDSRRGNRL